MSDINVARTNMARDISNEILSKPKFVAGITCKPKNGLDRISSKFITQKYIYGYEWSGRAPSAALVVVASLLGLRRLSVDVGLLPPVTGQLALRPLVYASQSLAFPFFGRALAFVRASLSFVCQLLAIIRDSLSLIGDPISSTDLPFASPDLGLTALERILTLIKRVGPTLALIWRIGAVDHSSP